MRQQNNSISIVITRHNMCVNTLRFPFTMDVDVEKQQLLLQKKTDLQVKIKKMILKTDGISSTTFNPNAFLDTEYIYRYRFRPQYLGILSVSVRLPDLSTTRKNYYCDRITSFCIILCRFSHPCTLRDIKSEFDMFSSKITEIFWWSLETFVEDKVNLLECRPELMMRRS